MASKQSGELARSAAGGPRVRRRVVVLLAVAAWIGPGPADRAMAQDRPDPQEVSLAPLDIRVTDDDWGGAQVRDIQKVCQSAATELWQYFPGRPLSPIVVSRSHDGPITLYDRLDEGQYQIRLDSQGNLWAQFSFQFAHEFCHVLCNYEPGEHPNKWFEESLCDLASIFALRRMAQTWETSPPYPNWKSYAPRLNEYADNLIHEAQLPEGVTLAKWYADNAEQLRTSHSRRELNRVAAVKLLPLFEKEPGLWQSVGYLNTGKGFKQQTLAQYLRDWEYFAPTTHKASIRQIIDLLGVN
jgi:hypothetical protein